MLSTPSNFTATQSFPGLDDSTLYSLLPSLRRIKSLEKKRLRDGFWEDLDPELALIPLNPYYFPDVEQIILFQ